MQAINEGAARASAEEGISKKVKAHTRQRPKTARAYPGFLSMKHATEYCYSHLDGMLVHRRVTLQHYVASTHLYTWVKRDKVG